MQPALRSGEAPCRCTEQLSKELMSYWQGLGDGELPEWRRLVGSGEVVCREKALVV